MNPVTHNTRARDKANVQQRDVAFARSAPTYGRWISWIVVLVVAANFLWLVATNPNFEWKVVLQWFTEGSVMKGLQVTLGLTVVSMILGTLLGLLLAVWRLSENKRHLVALHLVFPRYAAAGAADLLVQPVDAVSEHFDYRTLDGHHLRQLEHQRSDYAADRCICRTGPE